MRQICVKMRQKCAEHLWGRTPFARYRLKGVGVKKHFETRGFGRPPPYLRRWTSTPLIKEVWVVGGLFRNTDDRGGKLAKNTAKRRHRATFHFTGELTFCLSPTRSEFDQKKHPHRSGKHFLGALTNPRANFSSTKAVSRAPKPKSRQTASQKHLFTTTAGKFSERNTKLRQTLFKNKKSTFPNIRPVARKARRSSGRIASTFFLKIDFSKINPWGARN